LSSHHGLGIPAQDHLELARLATESILFVVLVSHPCPKGTTAARLHLGPPPQRNQDLAGILGYSRIVVASDTVIVFVDCIVDQTDSHVAVGQMVVGTCVGGVALDKSL